MDREMAWAEDEIKAMLAMEAQRPNQQGQMDTYTGMSIAQLLEMAACRFMRPRSCMWPMAERPQKLRGKT